MRRGRYINGNRVEKIKIREYKDYKVYVEK